jgi:hypothetical protein
MSNILYISEPKTPISGASFILSHLCYCTDKDCTKFTKQINDNLPTFAEPGDGMRISKQSILERMDKQITEELMVVFHLSHNKHRNILLQHNFIIKILLMLLYSI